VVLDLFSRQVIGWSMQSRIDREHVLAALLMAVVATSAQAGVMSTPTRAAGTATTTGRPS